MKRLYYLDNLRIFLSILVVLHHVGIGYGTMGGWCYITGDVMKGNIQIFLSALFGIGAVFSMSLFFFISAYLITHSLEKKGAAKFLKNQFIRLGIPLLFVMVLFAPSILYFIEIHNNTTNLSWMRYIYLQNINSPNTSHAWFILALIIFECIYVAYYKYIRPNFMVSKVITDKLPSHWNLVVFISVCSLATFLVRVIYPIGQNFIGFQFANFPLYVFMYYLGILVKRKNWLDLLANRISTTWFYFSLVLCFVFVFLFYKVLTISGFINTFLGGFTFESFLLSFMETIICIGFCAFCLVQFKKFLNFSNTIFSKMAENRYGVYIFHSAVVVGVTILLEKIYAAPFIKFFIACLLSVTASYLLVAILRKIQFVKKVI